MFVIAGETIVDMIERSKEPNVFDAHLGGAPYNVAKAAAKMGVNTGYLSPLSQDSFGDQFVDEMKSLGVEALAMRSSKPSGLAIVKTDDQGHPSYSFHRDDAADRDVAIIAVQSSFPKNASMFYVGGLALADGDDAETWTKFTQSVTTPIFVDPNIRPSFIRNQESYLARLERIYAACDILKLSDEDIEWLAPDRDPADYMRETLQNHNIPIGFLTHGSKGAEVLFKGESQFLPAPKITVQDTVGAGDCFSAATSAWILRKGGLNAQTSQSLKSGLNYAITAAAINCTRAGANAPTHSEILEFLDKI